MRETISKPEEVGPALKRMFKHKGPYVLDVKYPYNDKSHGHVIPMIPGGHTYLDTILNQTHNLREYFACIASLAAAMIQNTVC